MNEISTSSQKDSAFRPAEQQTSYAYLEMVGRKKLLSDGRGAGQVANFVTALNAWRTIVRRDTRDLLGADFNAGFDKLFLHYQDVLAEKIAPRTLKDRCEQILWWRAAANEQSGADKLPKSFSEALTVVFERSGMTKVALCRMAGISAPTLNRWLGSGVTQSEPGANFLVTEVERALDLTEGTLSRRLSVRRRRRYERVSDKQKSGPQTTYGMRVQRNRRTLANYSLDATPRFKAQWASLIALKTDTERPGATTRNSWRTKPPHKVGMRVHWSMRVNDKVCVTAGAHYRQISSYLGFIGLSKAHGGLGLPVDGLDTLAWLTRSEYVIAYIRFVRRRADGLLHNGLFTLLDTFRSHLRPKTGYVWLDSSLAQTLSASVEGGSGIGNDAWRKRCEDSYDALMDYTQKLRSEGKPKRSRDPNERVRSIVATEQPIKVLLRAIRELENDPPPQVQRRNYAVWIRDVLLLKLLARHPLRVHHYSIMTFRGAMPNLYRSGALWELQYGLEDFKNAKSGSAAEYRVTLDSSLAPWLARYLSEARPLLIGADNCDYVFLPGKVGNRGPGAQFEEDSSISTGAWTTAGISTRIKTLTGRYMPDGTSFGSHAFRHITATDHLKRHPNEFVLVAKILNDSLATVLKEYDHTGQQDAMRVLGSSVDAVEHELNAEAEKPSFAFWRDGPSG